VAGDLAPAVDELSKPLCRRDWQQKLEGRFAASVPAGLYRIEARIEGYDGLSQVTQLYPTPPSRRNIFGLAPVARQTAPEHATARVRVRFCVAVR